MDDTRVVEQLDHALVVTRGQVQATLGPVNGIHVGPVRIGRPDAHDWEAQPYRVGQVLGVTLGYGDLWCRGGGEGTQVW